MRMEHSERMADLDNREEEAKKQVNFAFCFYLFLFLFKLIKVATWEQMYREWMATMERRVNNLQVTNEDLQVYI